MAATLNGPDADVALRLVPDLNGRTGHPAPLVATSRQPVPGSASKGGYPPTVITGELKSKIDRVWDAFWSGGISNPLEVIEQITYLLFIRRLDDLQLNKEAKAKFGGGGVIQDPVYLPGQS